MMNTRKTLMIAGGLLVAATGASYLMLLKADHRAMAEAAAGMDDSARTPDADSRLNEDHASQGSVGQPALSAATTKSADTAQQQPPAPVRMAPASSPAAPSVSTQAQPTVRPSEPPSTAVVSVDAEDSSASKANPAQQAPRRRDGLERHATTNQATTPETAALVRESSKLDPSLPPPELPVRSSTDPRSSSAGSNPVAAAMTEQLVRESSNLDPSLPPPKDHSAAIR